MKITTVAVIALSLAFLSACDRGQRPATSGASGSSAAPAPQTQTPPSSANNGKIERNPVQGQVDPKEPAQQKDFQRK